MIRPVLLALYALSAVPAAFMAFAAYGEMASDLSGDARNAFVGLAAYLVAAPILIFALTRSTSRDSDEHHA
jgi:hypothetical protein